MVNDKGGVKLCSFSNFTCTKLPCCWHL